MQEERSQAEAAAAGSGVPSTIPVVGIGASAGGVEALTQFFRAMPADSGAAFVVVLHLDPVRESQLASILARHTPMPVAEITDGMTLAPGHVYVIVPDRDLTVDGDLLRLVEPSQPRGHRHPVDVLFRSLAEQRRERAVAIVLSGTGTNGTQGLREVKSAGGLVLVEDPAVAQFDGMPRSAIGAGLADHVLAPEEMPSFVRRYLRHGYFAAPDGLAGDRPGIQELLALLRADAHQDFASYKSATLLRRINRRMSLGDVGSLAAYLDVLRAEPGEVRALVRDLLINVTSFFRDAEAWVALDELVVTQMIADRETGGSLRVWVPACATGEEAYSIAMLLAEGAEAARKRLDIKVFASDVLEENLNAGRAGVYPTASVETLPPERVRRFFEWLDGTYQVRKGLRDLIVFARQDLLRDPPLSRIDLITCRNMLIYVDPESQRRALTLFHFALREGGRLFLGSSESIGRADELFGTVSKKWRIYRRLGPTRHDIVDFPLLGGHPRVAARAEAVAAVEPSARATETARRALLERYAPPAVLIDRGGRVLTFHGDTGDYLRQPSGQPTRDLLAMARDGLAAPLRTAMGSTFAGDQETRFSTQIRRAEGSITVLVTLSAVPSVPPASGPVLVTFEPRRRESPPPPTAAEGARLAASALEDELRSTRAELQGTIEQLEGMNEELKAANEEATSMNEELQSTNEELETSKEELQSFNEELHSVNSQLQHKIGELDETSNDLANLLSGTETATVFLDQELRVKWFSPATKQLLDLVSSDVGRPMAHFARKFVDDRLLDDAEAVLARLAPIEAEVRSDAGRWFLRRVLPYRTRDDRIAGLVITFTDITERRQATDTIDEARIYAEAIVATARQPLVVLDAGLRVRSANGAFHGLFGTAPDKVRDRPIDELRGGELDSPELRTLLQDVLPRGEQLRDVEMVFGPNGPAPRTMMLDARKLMRNGGREDLILVSIEDITERRRAAARQELLIGELNHRVKNVLATVQAIMVQTLRQSTTVAEFQPAFEGRLRALADAHSLLVEGDWVGAQLGPLVARTLTPYATADASRVVMEGPPVALTSRGGVALVMVLHELATNAAKYGALSAVGGRLSVAWRREEVVSGARVYLLWCETGGPSVFPPSRPGFGTRLIEVSMAQELGGAARIEYLPAGLRCELTFPWAERQQRAGIV